MIVLPALLCYALVADSDAFAMPSSPAAAHYGYLAHPSFDVEDAPGRAETAWQPQPGDVLLFASDKPRAVGYYLLGQTGPPSHTGLVVRMPDGRLGVFESGGNDTWTVTLTAIEERIPTYSGRVWVRRRMVPLTPDQDRLLCAFAAEVLGLRYPFLRAAGHGLMIRPRGPIRTFFMGRPSGIRDGYICAELVLEALVYAELIDADTARPSATYPRDLFKDDSLNLYIHEHPPLKDGWQRPARWTPVPASSQPPLQLLGPPVPAKPIRQLNFSTPEPDPLPPREPQLWERFLEPWPGRVQR